MDTKEWSILKYKGNTIFFSGVCAMFPDMEQDLIAIWQHKVLHNLELRMDYQELVDDPSNTDISYFFIHNKKNMCFGDCSHLVRAIVAGKGTFCSFLLSQDGDLVWNHAVHCWAGYKTM